MTSNQITKRIDAITGIPENYRKTVLPAPKSVKIELTSQCNFRCGFCAHHLRIKKRGDMDWELFMRLANEMRAAGVEELGVFYIGEPFSRPQILVDAIRYAKRVVGFPYVFCTTNGSLAWPYRVAAAMEAGLDSLKFSLNNSTPEQLSEIAQVKGDIFYDIKNNLQTAWRLRKDLGYKTGLYASSIMYDGDQQQAMERLVQEIRPFVDQHYWLPLYSMGSLATKREEELGFRPIAGNQGRIENLRDPLPCWSAFTEGHMTYDGKLSACCFDAGDKWTMADLTRTSFMEGWNSEIFQTLRAVHLKKDVTGTICEDCVAYRG